MPKVNGLTPKQEAFCLEYIKTKNATQSALVAGYSPRTAHASGRENIHKPAIKARLAELREKAGLTEKNAVMPVRERLEILADIARTTPQDIMEISEDGKTVRIKPEALKSKAINYLRTEEVSMGGGKGKEPTRAVNITRLNLIDRVRAIDTYNKMDGTYTEKDRDPKDRIPTFIMLIGNERLTAAEIRRIGERGGEVVDGEAKEIEKQD